MDKLWSLDTIYRRRNQHWDRRGLLGFRYDGGGFGSIEQGYDANHDAPFSGKLLSPTGKRRWTTLTIVIFYVFIMIYVKK